MGKVYRIYVEKRPGVDIEARGMCRDLRENLMIAGLRSVRVLNRYDVENLSVEEFRRAQDIVFSEPPVDTVSFDDPVPGPGERIFAVEYLPGQFDQRADSAAQCVALLTLKERPLIRSARVYLLAGELTDEEFERVKRYVINPVESREASLERIETLRQDFPVPQAVEVLEGFTALDAAGLRGMLGQYGLAMDFDDLKFVQDYFAGERRDPTMTELRMIDTYWSDHCRHTTFLTEIDSITIDSERIQKSYDAYLDIRRRLGRESRPKTLMDLATIGAKELRRRGFLQNLDESEEINACSIVIKVDVDGEPRDYLLMFKNETHNHPTEIEPFGGAATCLGGAIRDPLSGRSYVYQAMRVTGAADPRVPVGETLPGKLPQKKLVNTAAAGYSSYGNQIGLATGYVNEVYHPNYVAKRMEIGAVVGAAPCENVVRERPEPGDVVILLGGRTGRDGIGGATGSSKSHTASSTSTCGAEVQKGNPPEERKLQRLFRNPEATRLIRRCNDFGAGGVSVAIGELADGLAIDLDRVPKKYEGLDGTELAISESQERMAVVVREGDAARFIALAGEENLEATQVAMVTAEPRLRMSWAGQQVVDLSREFLNSNGAPKHTDIHIDRPETASLYEGLGQGATARERFLSVLGDLNVCSQKGLVDRFDGTIGAASVTMPYGGAHQLTPVQSMAAKIPVEGGETDTASVMAYGFNPAISVKSPYHGAAAAVVESVAKLVAAGCDYRTAYLTFQEYFERTRSDPRRWGKPAAALLGALEAQLSLGLAAIGGKDSMSGTFEDIDVPPTLVSFAITTMGAGELVTPEFKQAGDELWLVEPAYDADGLVDFASLKAGFEAVRALVKAGGVRAAWAVSTGGICEAVCKMAFGNRLGAALETDLDLYRLRCGAILLEVPAGTAAPGVKLGRVLDEPCVRVSGESLPLDELLVAWQSTLEPVFPTQAKAACDTARRYDFGERAGAAPAIKNARPRVAIPVFPGTNCEYDSARAFERAGAEAEIFVIRNLTAQGLTESVEGFYRLVERSQIVMLPGGFSGGDEPDGSGKFIAAFLRNPKIADAIERLLHQRDGLMLGICNGFQALVKLGLVPTGHIVDLKPDSPTLTFNTIGRHQSTMVRTRVSSVKSPWFANVAEGDIHTIAISHGEGRFLADEAVLAQLAQNGQIATQYVDFAGEPSMDIAFNPNGSVDAIEGITSPDGRVLGKMGHSERMGRNICKNVPGEKDQKLFLSGVEYFK
ncbi:phosphoribosylformylglycinamidine synthase [Feifania hominis]|uniref:Phosphoribosylformylglycinamidine synthase n=1 Tax=Feifania hominis TaxID=2763660 RepID=A0A926HUD8_9FIRM|nr:phosphoribosylformylglycinamidine synthase [Feifania hominis]MBC8536809.1 phosphoribosylformylglycinamidine synthase [Feifania hominis]